MAITATRSGAPRPMASLSCRSSSTFSAYVAPLCALINNGGAATSTSLAGSPSARAMDAEPPRTTAEMTARAASSRPRETLGR